MKRERWLAPLLSLTFLTAGCGGDEQPAKPSGSDAAAGAPATGLCALFTKAEIEEILGARVDAGKSNEGMGICHWDGSSASTAIYAQIQVLHDTGYWVKQTLAEGYEELNGIGREAFIVPELGGWSAQALTETSVVAVALNGGKADRDRTIRFLSSVLERLKGT